MAIFKKQTSTICEYYIILVGLSFQILCADHNIPQVDDYCSPNATECYRKHAEDTFGCQVSCSGLYADIRYVTDPMAKGGRALLHCTARAVYRDPVLSGCSHRDHSDARVHTASDCSGRTHSLRRSAALLLCCRAGYNSLALDTIARLAS